MIFREVWRTLKDAGTCWIVLGDCYGGPERIEGINAVGVQENGPADELSGENQAMSSAGRILGLISIGDINAQYASHQEATIEFLNSYIYGRT